MSTREIGVRFSIFVHLVRMSCERSRVSVEVAWGLYVWCGLCLLGERDQMMRFEMGAPLVSFVES